MCEWVGFSNNFELLLKAILNYQTVTGMYQYNCIITRCATKANPLFSFCITFTQEIDVFFLGAIESARKHKCSPRQALDS